MDIRKARKHCRSWSISSIHSVVRAISGRAPLAASAFAFIVLTLGCSPRAYQQPMVDSNRVAPEFTAETLEGRRVQLSNLRGKVVILYIWAAWRCADELPALDEMASRLLPHDTAVVALSIDSDIARLKDVARSRAAWRLSILHDPMGQVARQYAPRGFPAAYVIDRVGRIHHAHWPVSSGNLPLIESQAAELAAK